MRAMLFLLSAVGALGSVAIHFIVPAMPAIAADLDAASASVQLAISLYLIGMAAGQLAGGVASDRIGRRPVVLAALALFTLGSVGAASAHQVAILIGYRLAQAMGGGAAIICARAIVADLSKPDALAGRIAVMTSILLISPALAPAVGGLVVGGFGWRGNFVILAVFGVALLAICAFRLRETFKGSGNAEAASRKRYWELFKNENFLRLTIVIACSSSTMFAFLTASPFLLIEGYGLAPSAAGLCYLAVAGAGVAGTFAVRAAERRGGAFRKGVFVSLTGATSLLVLGLSGLSGPITLITPMLMIAFGVGLSSPAGMAAILSMMKGMAGTASSVAGAAQMCAAGLTTTLIAQVKVESPVSLAVVMVVLCSAGFLLAAPGPADDGS